MKAMKCYVEQDKYGRRLIAYSDLLPSEAFEPWPPNGWTFGGGSRGKATYNAVLIPLAEWQAHVDDLTTLVDIGTDRDGETSAVQLGLLVDELTDIARRALDAVKEATK